MNTTFRTLLQTLFIACCFVLYTAAHAQEPTPPPATPPEAAPAEPAEPAEPAPPAAEPETPPAEPAAEVVEEEDPFAWEGDRNIHRGDPVVSVGDDSTLAEGERAEAVVSVFGSSTAAGEVDEAVVAVFGDARATGRVGEAVVAVLGDTYVNNRVGEAVVAVLGSVELGPEANVGGVVVIGGDLKRHPDAVVRGGVQRIFAGEIPGLSWLRPWTRHALVLGRPLALEPGLGWAWGIALAFLALYIGFALLFRDGVDRCVQTLETRPGQTVMAAIITALLTPILILILLVSVLGIAAVPFLALGLFGATLFGKSVVLAWIGRRCTSFLGDDMPVKHTAFAVLVGGLVVLALYLVPFLGFILFNTIAVLGLGVVVYTMLLGLQSSRRERAAAAAAGGNGGSPGAPAGGAPAAGFADASAPNAARSGGPGSFTAYSGAAPGDTSPSFGPATGFAPGASSAAGGIGGEPPYTSGAQSAGGAFASGAEPGAGTASGAGTTGAGATYGAAGAGGAPPAARTHGISDVEAAALPRARFWVRMGALAIDVVMISILFGMINQGGELWLLALGTYGAVMWKLKGTTIGGIVFGLRVVRRDGRPIDWATAIVRALSCFLSMIVAGLGFIWIALDDEKQAWHDKIAGTVVVTMPKGVSLL
jgi:uncharacterized RDD family membrane protein YckC